MIDYYQTLELPRKASAAEIAQQYQKLALRYHPSTTKQEQGLAAHQFDALAEAYEVLSDPLKRAFYDKHGAEALKEGLYHSGNLQAGYRYGHNPLQIYNAFFQEQESTGKVLDLQINQKGSLLGHAFGGLNYRDPHRCPDLMVPVQCTLEELYKGTGKLVEFQRKTLGNDGRTTNLVKAHYPVHIKPGYGNNTVLKIEGQGHQNVHGSNSDLLVKIVEMPHPAYTRKGNNLVYTQWLSLAEAFECASLSIPTLDNRTLSIPVHSIPNPSSLEEVQGQGMTDPETGDRGSLYIRFRLSFPSELSEQVRSQLRALLSDG